MRVFGIGFGKKKVNVAKLTHDERVSIEVGNSEDALGMFAIAHRKLEDTNTNLRQIATEASNAIYELQRSADKANGLIGANEAVQVQLKPFLIQ